MNNSAVIEYAARVLQQVGSARTADKLRKIWDDRYALLERYRHLSGFEGVCYEPFHNDQGNVCQQRWRVKDQRVFSCSPGPAKPR